MTKRLFVVLSMTFMLIINSGNAYAGTDIINGILLKAGNVIDKISLKYQEISLEIHKVLEGKMFSLDETTKNLIRNSIQDYEAIKSYVEQIKNAEAYAEDKFMQTQALFDRISQRLIYVDEQALEHLKERGWKIGNSDDNTDNEENAEDVEDDDNDSTANRSGGALRGGTVQTGGTTRGGTGRGGDNNGNGRGSDSDDDNSSAGRTITRQPFSFGDDDSDNSSSNNNSSQNSAEPDYGSLTERANGA